MATNPAKIDNPDKIGIGTWDIDNLGTALQHVEGLGFSWYYNWQVTPLWDSTFGRATLSADFVPMVWGANQTNPGVLSTAANSGAGALLGFNEPDHPGQSNLTVEQALALWPQLMATGLRLGSPGTTIDGALGADSWTARFMLGVETQGYKVDFLAVHYYSTNKDVGAFQTFLENVYNAYGLPIWVTEWALVDWSNPKRFSLEETAAFAFEAAHMLDDLAFVERHAWFAAYEGGDGWYINTQLFDKNGGLTPVGQVFAQLLEPPIAPTNSQPSKTVSAAEVLQLFHIMTGSTPDEATVKNAVSLISDLTEKVGSVSAWGSFAASLADSAFATKFQSQLSPQDLATFIESVTSQVFGEVINTAAIEKSLLIYQDYFAMTPVDSDPTGEVRAKGYFIGDMLHQASDIAFGPYHQAGQQFVAGVAAGTHHYGDPLFV
jgi:hypothetical protein